jgi:ribosome-dependent ATPase
MKEAERCDRVSLMHAGKVLAVGTPGKLAQEIGVATLEEAFVAHIEQTMPDAAAQTRTAQGPLSAQTTLQTSRFDREASNNSSITASIGRIAAFARREAVELSRDPIRIAFALFGPLSLLITLGYGINFDVNKLPFAVLDRDRTAESRQLIQEFAASRYFDKQSSVADPREIDRRLKSGEIRFVMSIPPRFGKDMVRDRRPDVAFFLDGANTFRAETVRGYIEGTMLKFGEQNAGRTTAERVQQIPVRLEERFRYNQNFESAAAIVPGSIMIILVLIPAMMAALGVVREREIGSISNLYSSPATISEFIVGKQLPYIALSYMSFVSLVLMAVLQFGLSIKGSVAALFLAGLLYVFATTGLGLFVSSFVKTQIAALIAAAVICVVPSFQFSGYLYPAATLEGFGYYMGHGFPSLWFQNVVLGTFAKGQAFATFLDEFAILFAFGLVFLLAARVILRKQEA